MFLFQEQKYSFHCHIFYLRTQIKVKYTHFKTILLISWSTCAVFQVIDIIGIIITLLLRCKGADLKALKAFQHDQILSSLIKNIRYPFQIKLFM